MTGRIEKTVFISYRRTSSFTALAVYQSLTSTGYDVFFDYEGINSGDFEQVILGNIRARAHFIVILTPSALERCNEPGDWLRREIETAIDEKRNIVPLFFEGFNFGSPALSPYLIGKLQTLKKYNGINVPADYFYAAMEKLVTRFLNIPLDAVLQPLSDDARKGANAQKAAVQRTAKVTEDELSAEAWFEKGYNSAEPAEKIFCYTEAIHLKPGYADAFNNRGNAQKTKGDLEAALKDYNEAIRLKSNDAFAFNNRGIARKAKGDLDGAIRDYTEAIRIQPGYATAFYNRGNARKAKGDLDAAIKDYTESIRLKPNHANAFINRGIARYDKGDLDAAIRDYTEAIRLKPNNASVFINRGDVYQAKGDLEAAIRDYQKYIQLSADIRDGDREKVEGMIRSLQQWK